MSEASVRFARCRPFAPVAALALLPILVKLPLLTGLLVADPMARYAELQRSWRHGITAGLQTIDPNIAHTSHALGTYAAREWLHGRIPWWNPFEGVGAPLVGEMQSAALFPPTLLLALPNGQLFMHLLLQILAGLFTYGLLRALALRRTAATAGAVAFQFNAVFAWMANAVVNPVAFLPLVLWGVELQCCGDGRRRGRGAAMIALGLALSLYADFPEVAYLDGLLIAAWTTLRLAQARRDRGPLTMGIGFSAIAGVLLAAPLLVAFAGYLPLAELGIHGEGGFAHLDPRYLLLAFFPYWSGGIFTPPLDARFWGNVGGYAGTVLPVLAAAALFGTRERALRWTLAGWVVVTLALTFGASWLFDVVKLLPGLREAALYRYLPASWLMALCALAAMAIDDLQRTRATRPILLSAGMSILLWAALLATAHGAIGSTPRNLFGWLACLMQIGVFAALVAALERAGLAAERRVLLVSAVLAIDAISLFSVPVWAHRGRIETALGSVGFLQRNLGLQRFATLGPIAPNYGTYFGIAEVNHNDLPSPSAWYRYVRRHLDRAAHPVLFLKVSTPAEFLRNRRDFARIGTRFVVAPASTALSGLTRVYADDVVAVYELADARPYFSAPGCTLRVRDRTLLTADCPVPARLTRLELAMPGWRASLSGQPAAVAVTYEIFQSVSLPAGRHEVAFRYTPPYLAWSLAVMAVGLVLLIVIAAPTLRRRSAR